MARGRGPVRNQFGGVFIAQFIQGEIDAFGDRERLPQQVLGIDPEQLIDGPQKPLAVGIKPITHLFEGLPAADGGEGILQHPALAAMHVDVAAGEHRQTEFPGGVLPPDEPFPVPAASSGVPPPATGGRGKRLLEPGAFPLVGSGARQPQDQAVRRRQIVFEILPGQTIGAFFGRSPAMADKPRKRPVSGAIRRQHDRFSGLLRGGIRCR